MGLNVRASKRIILRRRLPVRLVRSARLQRQAQLKDKEYGSIKKKLRSTTKQNKITIGQTVQESSILDQLDEDNLPQCQSEKQKEKVVPSIQGEHENVVNEHDTEENTPNGICCLKDNLPYVLLPRLSGRVTSSYQSETDNGSETSAANFEKTQSKKVKIECKQNMPVLTTESSVVRNNNPKEIPMVEFFTKSLSLNGKQINKSESKEELSIDPLLHSEENDKVLGIKQNGAVSIGQQKGHKYLNKLSKKNRLNMYKLNLERRLTRSVGVDVKVNYKSSLPDATFRKRKKKLQQQPLQKIPSPDISAKNVAGDVNYVSRPGTSSGYNQSCLSSDMSTLPTILRNSEITKNSDSEIDDEEDLTESNKRRGKNGPKEVVDVIDGIAFVTFESEHDMVRFTRSTTEESPTKADGDFGVQLESHGAITPRKTKDIRKIKGWQRKKFSITLNPMNELYNQDIESSEMNDSSADNIVFEHNYIRRRSNSYEGCAALDEGLHDFKDASTASAQHIFSSSVVEEKLTEITNNAIEKVKILEWKPSAKSAFVSFSSSHSDAEIKKVDPPSIQSNLCQVNVQESSEQHIAEKLSRENSENASDSHNIKMKAIIQQKRAGKRPAPLKMSKAIQVALYSRQKMTIEEGDEVKYPTYNWHPSFQNSWTIDYERALFAVKALTNKLPRRMIPSVRKRGRPRGHLRNRLNIIGRRRRPHYSVQNPVPVRRTRASYSLFQISEPSSIPLVRIPFVSSKSPSPPLTKSPSVDSRGPHSPYNCHSPQSYLSPSSPSIVETPSSSETNPSPLPVVQTLPSTKANLSPPPVVQTQVSGRITPSPSSAHSSNNPENSKIETPIGSSLPSSVKKSSQFLHIQSLKESAVSTKSPSCPSAPNFPAHSASASLYGKNEKTGSNVVTEMDQTLRKSGEKKDSTHASSSRDNVKSEDDNNGSKRNLSDSESSEKHLIWEICHKKKFPRKEMSPDQECEDLRVFLRPKPRFQEILSTQEVGIKDSSFHGVGVRADNSYAVVNNSSPPKNGEVEVFKSGSPKSPSLVRKKLIRELSKLSANFVSVDNCNTKFNEECTKEFCRLGCVCESIRTEKRQIEHCGRVECMFSCVCTPKEHVSRPAQAYGSDDVSRLQEESSRHMAKVEKAFHNTVVEAAGELVLPGRRQRERRLPKRFLDEDMIPEPLFVTKKPKSSAVCSKSCHDSTSANKKNEAKTYNQVQTKPSKIVLYKLPLSGSNIRCMNHFMENCPCLYKGPRNIAIKSTTPRNMAYLSKRHNRTPGCNLLSLTNKVAGKQSHENIGNNFSKDSQGEISSVEIIVVDSNYNLELDEKIRNNENHLARPEKESLGTKTVKSQANEEKEPVKAGNVSCDANTEKTLPTTGHGDDLICGEVISSSMRNAIEKGDFTIYPVPESPLSLQCARTAGIDLWISQHYSESSTTVGHPSKTVENPPKKNDSPDKNPSDLISQEESAPLFKIVEVKSLPPSSFDAATNTFEECDLNQVNTPLMKHFPNYDYFYSWLNSSQTRIKDLQHICTKSLAPLAVNAVKVMKWKELDKLLKSHSAHMWIRQRLGSSARIYVTQNDVQPDSACVNFLDLERKEELTAKVAHILNSAQNELSIVHGCCILICKGAYWEIAGNINLNGESQSDNHALETKNLCKMNNPKIVSFRDSATGSVLKNHVTHSEISGNNRIVLKSRKPPVGDCNLNNINSELSSSPELNVVSSSAPKVTCNLNQADILDPDQILLDIETALPDILQVLTIPKDAEKTAATSRFSPKIVSATSIRDEIVETPKLNEPSALNKESPDNSAKKVLMPLKTSVDVCKVGNCTLTSGSNVGVDTAPSPDDENVLDKGKQSNIPTNDPSKTELSNNQRETSSIKYVELETLSHTTNSLKNAEQTRESAISPTSTNNAVIFPIHLNDKKKAQTNRKLVNLTDVAQSKKVPPRGVEKISIVSCVDGSKVKIIPEKENVLSEAPSTSCPTTNPIRKTASDRIIEKMTSIVESPRDSPSDSSNSVKSGAEAPPVLIIDLKKLKENQSNLVKKPNVSVKIPVRVTNLRTLTQGLNESRGKMEILSDKKTYSAKYIGNNDFSVREIITSKDSNVVDVKEMQERIVKHKGASGTESRETITLTYLKENTTKLTNDNHVVQKPFMHVIQPLRKGKPFIHVIKPVEKLASTVNAITLSETKETNQIISKMPQTQEKDSGKDLTNDNNVKETSEVPVSSTEPVSVKQTDTSTKPKLANDSSPTPNISPILKKLCNNEKADMEHSLEVTKSTSPGLQNEVKEVVKTKEKSEDSLTTSLSQNNAVNDSQKIIQTNPGEVEKSLSSSYPSTPSQAEDKITSSKSKPLPVEMAVTSALSIDADVATPSSIMADVAALKGAKENSSEDDVIWYRLHLNNEFDRLTVEGTTFSTSEKRLISAVTIARSSNRTVRLTFDKSASPKECQEFKKGIYAVPTTEGLYVKIGPYRRNEATGVITLKKEGQAYKPTLDLLRLEDPYCSSSDVNVNNENPAGEGSSSSSNPPPKENKLNQTDQEKGQSDDNIGGDDNNTVEPELRLDEKIKKLAEVKLNVDLSKKINDSSSVVEDKNSHGKASKERESDNSKVSISAEGKIAENCSNEVEAEMSVAVEGKTRKSNSGNMRIKSSNVKTEKSVTVEKKTKKSNSGNTRIESSNLDKREKLSDKEKTSKVIEEKQEPLKDEESIAICSISANNYNGIQNAKTNSMSGNVSSNPSCIVKETEDVMLDSSVTNNPPVDSHGGGVGEKTDDKVVTPSLSLTVSLQDPNQLDVLLEDDDNERLHKDGSKYDTGHVSEEEMDVKFDVSKADVAEGGNKSMNFLGQDIDESTGNEDSGDFAIKIHDVQGNWSGFTDLPNCDPFENQATLFQHDSRELMTEIDKSLQNGIRHVRPVDGSSKFGKKNQKTGLVETEKSSILPLEVMERLRKKKLIGPFKTKPYPVKKGRKGLRVSLPIERKHLNESDGGKKEKVLKTLFPKKGPSKTKKDEDVDFSCGTSSVSPDEDKNQIDDGDGEKDHNVLKNMFPKQGFSKIIKDENVGSTPGKFVSGYLFPDIPQLAPIRVTRKGGSLPSEASMITIEDPAKPGVNIQLANVECVNAYIMYVLREQVKFFPEELKVKWTFVKTNQWSSTSGMVHIKDLNKELFITPKGVFKYADYTNMEDLNFIGLNRQDKFRFFEMKRRKEIDQAKLELGLLLVSQSKLNEMTLEKILKLALSEIRILKSQKIDLSQKNVFEARKKLILEKRFKALLRAQSFTSAEIIPDVDETSAIDAPGSVHVKKSSRGAMVKTRGGKAFRSSSKPVTNEVTHSLNASTTASSNISKGRPRGRPKGSKTLNRKKVVVIPSENISQPPLVISDSETMPASTSLNIVSPVQEQDKNITQKCKLPNKSISISPNSVRKLLSTTSEPNSTDKNVPEATEENSLSAIDSISSGENDSQGQVEQPDEMQVSAKENKSVNALLWKESFRKVKINIAKSNALSPTSHGKVLESKKHLLKKNITALKEKALIPPTSSKSLPFWNGGNPPSPKTSAS